MAEDAKPEETVLGFAWYKPSQWARLLEVAPDARQLEPTYNQWRAGAVRGMNEMRRSGVRVEKVEVDVEQLVRWCEQEGREVDGEARAEFAAQKLREKYGQGEG
jgi:hypothetical protein